MIFIFPLNSGLRFQLLTFAPLDASFISLLGHSLPAGGGRPALGGVLEIQSGALVFMSFPPVLCLAVLAAVADSVTGGALRQEHTR